MDSLIAQNHELMETWPIEKRAEIHGGLPDRLSIKQIAKLYSPQDTKKQSAVISALIKLCKEGELKVYGDINGWEWGGSEKNYIPNPHKEIQGNRIEMDSPMRTAIYNKWRAAPADCLIHKDEFKKYLKSVNQQVTGLLNNWLGKSVKIKKKAGDTDNLRTEHAKEWVKENKYIKGMPDIKIITALQNDKPELWGSNETTFRKWIQKPEAKELFPNPRRK